MMKRTAGILLAGFLLNAVMVLGLWGPPGASAEGADLEIRIADSKGDWGFPNPFRHYPRGAGYIRLSWVYDTLVWKDRQGYIPALAKAWTYDPSGMAFFFDLQESATWHDGTPFTAGDVVFTIHYFKEHPFPWVPMGSIAGAEALGTHRVKISLAKPFAPFLAYVGGTLPILPRHIWKPVKDPKSFQGPGAAVGSGPFVFRDFDRVKGTYLFEAFTAYYQGVPRVKRLIYVKAGKPFIALSNGRVDLANIMPEMADSLERRGMVVLKNMRGWNKKLMLNHRVAPFSDKRFRKALAHALDRRDLIAKAHLGFGSPASFGLVSPDHAYYNPGCPTYSHDPERAGDLLRSMGYHRGPSGYFEKGGRPLEVELLASNITVAGESVADRDGEVLKRQLEASGIKVDLRKMDQAAADGRILRWEFQLALSGHGGLLGDAIILKQMVDPEASSGSVNSARFGANRELLDLVRGQVLEMDPEKRKAMVYRFQDLYAEELPAISLYYPDSLAAYNPGKGITWYYTPGGIAMGIPIAQNKMSLLDQGVSVQE